MQANVKGKLPASFRAYLIDADENYNDNLQSIDLFNPEKTAKWSAIQKKKFAGYFYHLRGHFINFIWYMANFSTDPEVKEILLHNIQEEIGIDNRFSHEQLYGNFARECGINIHDEMVNHTHNIAFTKNFNKSHLQWLASNDEHTQLATFAAYERLDNVDYHYLLKLAESLNMPREALTFFKVHIYVEHFDSTLLKLIPLWENSSEKIVRSFDFIYKVQQQMWQNLSAEIFAIG